MMTVLSRLRDHARTRPQAPAFAEKQGPDWCPTGWAAYEGRVRRVARALIDLGVAPGRTTAILGSNRPEWSIFALATMAAGGVPVGIYSSGAPRQIAYVLRHAESPVVLVEDRAQWEKVRQVRGELPHLEQVVTMRDAGLPAGVEELSWQQLLARGDGVSETLLDERLEALTPERLAVLIYTSGTTGVPKGVMLSHANLLETARICADLHGLRAEDSVLSYLPLAHIAEQMITIYMAVYVGYTVYYAESPQLLAENLRAVRPTIFFGVPRVWERIRTAVSERLAQASPLRRRVVEQALAVGLRTVAERGRGERPGPLLGFEEKLADRLVGARIRRRLGFDRLRLAASGAAPIAREVLEFFAALGVEIQEVYGLSETTGPMTWNHPGAYRLGTVGPALPRVEVRLAADGEVLTRGPNIFLGYYRDEASTREVFNADGWFHTGDVGEMSDDGFLTITGRKKEILITSGGKNVAPVGIEAALKELELISEAVVIGDGRRYLTALLTLETEALERFARHHGLAGDLHDDPRVLEAVADGVASVNERLARVETVRRFRVLPRNLTVEAGELTPTLKLRRREIEANWAELIEEMYAEA